MKKQKKIPRFIFFKKYHLRSEELVKFLITKMVRKKYKVDYYYIKENEYFGDVPWYQHFTWTIKEEEEFKKFFIKFLQTKVRPKLTKAGAEREYTWFNLQWGLKIKD